MLALTPKELCAPTLSGVCSHSDVSTVVLKHLWLLVIELFDVVTCIYLRAYGHSLKVNVLVVYADRAQKPVRYERGMDDCCRRRERKLTVKIPRSRPEIPGLVG